MALFFVPIPENIPVPAMPRMLAKQTTEYTELTENRPEKAGKGKKAPARDFAGKDACAVAEI
jgi:hypothetical protein